MKRIDVKLNNKNIEKIIYEDEKRKVTWSPGMVKIFSAAVGKELPVISMRNLICDKKIQAAATAAIKKLGHDPEGYRALYRIGKSDIVAPVEVAEEIYKEANRLQVGFEVERNSIANLPHNRERREIDELFHKASMIEKSDSEDNVWLPASIRSKARKMLDEWREKYPVEAAKEKAESLMSKASDLRSKAKGALVYDADGWFDEDIKQKRHDDFIAESEKLENEAQALLK